MPTISDRLRRVREKAGVTARGLDELTGLTPGHTTLIELGHRTNPEARTALLLTSVLGISLDWLLAGEGPEPTEEQVRAAVEARRAALAVTAA